MTQPTALPDRPDHGCAFCGAVLSAGAADMVTLFLGDPLGGSAVIWSHLGCLQQCVVPATLVQLRNVATGDFLPEHLRNRGSLDGD